MLTNQVSVFVGEMTGKLRDIFGGLKKTSQYVPLRSCVRSDLCLEP